MGTNDRERDKKDGKRANARQQTFRFINHDLSAEDQERLGAMDCAEEFPASLVDDLVEEGYKYSLTYDAGNHTFIASLTDKSKGSVFTNSCISGRGSSAINARYSLLYRHISIAQGDWAVFDQIEDKEPPAFG